MSVISPICRQDAFCPVLQRIAAHPLDILVGHIQSVHKLVPSAHPRAVILYRPRGSKLLCRFIALLLLVSPIQTNGLFGKFFNNLWEITDNVSPEHGHLAVVHQELEVSSAPILKCSEVNSGINWSIKLFIRARLSPSDTLIVWCIIRSLSPKGSLRGSGISHKCS